jgi:hypothetical protein
MNVLCDRKRELSAWWAALILPLLLAGCRPSYQRDTAPVRGRVTVDGQPVTSGYVIVIPSSGRMAKGTIQADGSFIMGTYSARDGVQLGSHPVVVHPVPADESSSGSRPPAGPKIPDRYGLAGTSQLQIEVTDEGNDAWNLQLTSQ